MSYVQSTEEDFHLRGKIGQAVVDGVSSGRSFASWITSPLPYIRPLAKLVFALFVLALIGVSSWTSLLLRRKLGMNYAILSWVLAIFTLMMLTPVAMSPSGWLILTAWWSAIILSGFLHVSFGVIRMYWVGTEDTKDHVHRWAGGEVRRPVNWLFNLLPAVIATNKHAMRLREPVSMLIIGLGLWLLHGILVHDTGDQDGATVAIFWVPVMSSVALLAEMLIGITQAKYAQQKLLDSMFEQQHAGEQLQDLQQVSHEREVEGVVTL